jgi:Rod binding domain-containing protein
MSIQAASASATTGLPVVNQALEPAWVRDGSASTQKAYESALSFEQTLVEQLSQTLTATSGLESESSSSGGAESSSEEGASSASGAGDSQLSSMLPQALSSGVMHAGGLGLAAQMTRDLEGTHPAVGTGDTAAQTQASGGVGPVSSATTTNPVGVAPAGAGAGASGGTPA